MDDNVDAAMSAAAAKLDFSSKAIAKSEAGGRKLVNTPSKLKAAPGSSVHLVWWQALAVVSLAGLDLNIEVLLRTQSCDIHRFRK